MKNVTIAGRLTRDAVLRTMNNGDHVLGFSVAVDDRAGKEKTTLFFDASLFGKRGDALAQYLTKGSSVTVSGDLGKREHEGKTYLTVRVNDVTLQGGKPQGEGERSRDDDYSSGFATSGANKPSGPRESYDLNDSIPF